MTFWALRDANSNIKNFAAEADPVTGILTVVHQAVPWPAGGLLIYRDLDLGTTGQVVKNAAGQIYTMHVANQHATLPRYLKLYNKASAPTSSDTPVSTFVLLANSVREIPLTGLGAAFSAGIGVRASTAIADNDTGAPSTNDVVINLFYF